jgi:hypothetical protein
MAGALGFLENLDFALEAGDFIRGGESRDRNQDSNRRSGPTPEGKHEVAAPGLGPDG